MDKEDSWFEQWEQSNGIFDKDKGKAIPFSKDHYCLEEQLKLDSKDFPTPKPPIQNKPLENTNETSKSWFENWLESNTINNKDQKRRDQTNYLKHNPFEEELDQTAYPPSPKQKKFYIEDTLSMDKWLNKNETFDKDKDSQEKEKWKYPPQNLYAVRIDSSIDLHQLTVSQSLAMLQQFILTCHKRNDKVIRVIHGKGNHSLTVPKVKIAVLNWLKTEGKGYIQFFKEADPKHGGAGATLVWLN